MAKSVEIKLEGMAGIKKFFADVQHEITDREIGQIIRAGGREVTKAAKRMVPFKGEVAKKLKKDLVTSRVKLPKNKPYVLIGPAFKETIGNQKVAVIAQHMTEGFKQKPRVSNGKSRGKVKNQLENAVLRGFDVSGSQRNAAMNKAVQLKLLKIKAKNRNVLI